jgi:hypothetical protein
MSAAMIFAFSTSPFSASLAAAFDGTVRPEDLQQMRSVPCPHEPINFVVFFRHIPTNHVLAYDLTINTWSDATSLRDWESHFVPQLSYPSRHEDPYAHTLTRLR